VVNADDMLEPKVLREKGGDGRKERKEEIGTRSQISAKRDNDGWTKVDNTAPAIE